MCDLPGRFDDPIKTVRWRPEKASAPPAASASSHTAGLSGGRSRPESKIARNYGSQAFPSGELSEYSLIAVCTGSMAKTAMPCTLTSKARHSGNRISVVSYQSAFAQTSMRVTFRAPSRPLSSRPIFR
jgi:hypothetical protein